jgi:two-component SAPR family response regulator
VTSNGEPGGQKVLIVEDRYLIATDLVHEVTRMGGTVVGPARDVESAAGLLEQEAVDVALLDVNLAGSTVFRLAERLAELKVPFAFVTGYDRTMLPREWRDRPVVTKPLREGELRRAMQTLAAPPRVLPCPINFPATSRQRFGAGAGSCQAGPSPTTTWLAGA